MMRARTIVPAIVLLLAAASAATAQDCLSYEPAEVSLTGRITKRVFPGPPNYESVRRGDRPETSWVLHLSRPICVSGNANEFNTAERGITDVQLILSPEEYRTFRRFVGTRKNVMVSGTLTHAQTGHHHTTVLLDVTTIKSGG